jgi:hypothetical protein
MMMKNVAPKSNLALKQVKYGNKYANKSHLLAGNLKN